MEQAQKDALKVVALNQRVAEIVAEYENKIADLRDMLDIMHDATGLRFVRNDESPELRVRWTTPDTYPELEGNMGVARIYGPMSKLNRIDGARILMNKELTVATTSGKEVTLHELGHALGLGHVSDPTQLMYPSAAYPYDWTLGSGDLKGLAKVGVQTGECS